MGARRSSCRVREQESKLTYRHAEPGTAKRKKKGIFKSAHCFLYLLRSQEGEREKLISLFFNPFSLQHKYLAGLRLQGFPCL